MDRSAIYDFLLVFYSNFVPKTHRFWNIRIQKCRDLEIRVRHPSRSLDMSPFDRVHVTSYWRSIVTTALSISYRLWDIQCRTRNKSITSKAMQYRQLYCHAHMLIYERWVNYNLNINYMNYLAQLCMLPIFCVLENLRRKFANLVAPSTDGTTKRLEPCKTH